MSLCGGRGTRGECPSARGQTEGTLGPPHLLTWSPVGFAELSFALAPAHYGSRGVCVELCAACVCVCVCVRAHRHKSAHPPAGRSMRVHGCDLPHSCSGRGVHVGVCNPRGHQPVPTCALALRVRTHGMRVCRRV
ncbi:hypothetical protein HJG60_011829 [Phyllostomus discolor]|uniref:Uncharacterized protein n=1 Tax=Phyllostomus discolor TaxID=89673 RepID=A0A834DVZ2_9CHIR|nr:hypothetical protein HJG60_011829 [Phyllostomus discolor]